MTWWAVAAAVLLVALVSLLIAVVVAVTREDPQWPTVPEPDDRLEEAVNPTLRRRLAEAVVVAVLIVVACVGAPVLGWWLS